MRALGVVLGMDAGCWQADKSNAIAPVQRAKEQL
jgi:hypothetical protein